MGRWLIHSSRTLLIIRDAKPTGDEVQFLAIAKTGAAREGKDSTANFRQKLVELSATAAPENCLAVLGLITINQDYFLLVVTEAVPIEVDRMKVHKVQKARAIPLGEINGEAAEALNGVLLLLEDHFYFSHDFDVTKRLQRRAGRDGRDALTELPSMSTAEPRFLWNSFLCRPLLNQSISKRWFTPVMQGFLQCHTLPGRNSSMLLMLLARRSCRHAGTRYNARGLDDDGEAANCVETEMLAKLPGDHWISLAQVRGSAPVFWEQKSSTSPVLATRGSQLQALSFRKHQELLREEYGQVFNVSLLSEASSKRDTEGALIESLKEQSRLHPQYHVKHLDLHARVTGEEEVFSKELDAVYHDIAAQIEGFGFFDAGSGSSSMTIRRQLGVLRTNCFDSLDRTNLLQYQVTWMWLSSYIRQQPQLQSFVPAMSPTGGYSKGLAFFDVLGHEPPVVNLQELLRNMWADLGDALSEQYTGAASTMGAALRQGGHTARAMLEKGWQAMNRAYCAHFEDGARQAALQCLLRPQKLPKVPLACPEARRSPQGKLLLATASWNLHGQMCWNNPATLKRLIQGACLVNGEKAKPDVFVFCFQEFTELSASNVVLLSTGDAVRMASFEAKAQAELATQLGEAFLAVRSVGMVGLLVSVFVAERLAPSIRAVSGDRIRSGLYGQAGNKGALVVTFKVEETSICTASVHLESGQQVKKAQERAEQLREILQSLCPEKGARPDLLVVSGDFNFRAQLPENTRATLTSGWLDPTAQLGEGAMSTSEEVKRLFFQCDEMHCGRSRQELYDILKDFSLMEGPVNFPPTYRLLEGQAAYDLEREPAWCDRVLHSKVSVQRKSYCALGLMESDHRPVCALLETLLLAMPEVRDATRTALPSTSKTPKTSDLPDLLEMSETHEVEQSTPQSSTQVPAEELLDLDVSPITPVPAPTPAPTPASTPASTPAATMPSTTTMGQLVFAKYQDGWYLANVIRPGGHTVDVAWLRPPGAIWGDKAQMAQYLCSTNADETLHGDQLPVATHIRLPRDFQSQSDLIDLLG